MGVLSVTLAALSLSPVIPPAGARQQVCRDWRNVKVPQVAGRHLLGVSATSKTDAWAVGLNLIGKLPPAMHWDGQSWKAVRQAAPDGDLNGVDGVSSADAWIIGVGPQYIAEHWNGTAWALFPVPVPGGGVSNLYNVSAASSTDVWAVGYYTPDVTRPFVEHWNGTAWSQVPAPVGPGGNGFFYSVEAISATDAWAVGYQDLSFADFQPLIEHWDGSVWTVVPTPPLAGSYNFLHSVSAVSSTDVWAVGNYRPDDILDLPLTMHWDGTAWSQVGAPSGGDQGTLLNDVEAISSSDVWAVGRFFSSQDPVYQPFSLHWDGTGWTARAAVSPGGQPALFESVSASGPRDVWAVGVSNRATQSLLIEHSTGPCPAGS